MGPGAATPEVVEALVKACRDEDAEVRCAAVSALGAVVVPGSATPEVVRAIVEKLGDTGRWVSFAAARALARIGGATAHQGVLVTLLERLRDGKASIHLRCGAAEALGALGSGAARPEVSEALVAATRERAWPVREAAARALDAWHRQGIRLFREPSGGWVVRTVEELSRVS